MLIHMNEVEKYGNMVKNLPQERKIRTDWNAKRAVDMAKLRFDEGLTLQKIGERYGLTRQRVHGIIKSLNR